MTPLAIYADSRGPGHCRSCGAAIEWAQLVSGRRAPFDRIAVVREQPGLVPGARVILVLDPAVSVTHFATCPDAKDWRRR